MGFTHKECVRILYAISGILGLASVSLAAEHSIGKTIGIIAVALIILILYLMILKDPKARMQSGLCEDPNGKLLSDSGAGWRGEENKETTGEPEKKEDSDAASETESEES